jgi:hypothetical protein
MTLTLGHFLSLGAILFALSIIGIFLNRKNLIILLMAIELMLLAVNMNFVAFSHYLGDHARPGLCVFHPDCGSRRVCYWASHPGAAVPQQVQHQRGRTQHAQGLNARFNKFKMSQTLSASTLLAVPLAPWSGPYLAGVLGTSFGGNRIGRRLSHTLTILGVLIAFVLSAMTLKSVAVDGARFNETLYTWMVVGGLKMEDRLPGRRSDRHDDVRRDLRVADGSHLHHRLYGRR